MLKVSNIHHIGVLLTSSCNLNCHHCADLIPYRPPKTYAKDMAISDLSKLLESVDVIEEVLLIGGEVLLYKDLPAVLQYCINQPQIKKVILTTNGTIMPKDELWTLLQNDKVVLRVSGYGPEVAPRREELIRETVHRRVHCEDFRNMVWKRIGDNRKRNRTIEALQGIFRQCSMRDCVTLNSDGILFFCSRQMAAYETEDYPSPLNYEILNVREISSEQLTFALHHFYSLTYISTCDYCDGINFQSKDVETAKQILPKAQYVQLLNLLFDIKHAHHVEQQLKHMEQIVGILLQHNSTLAQKDGIGAFLENIANLEFKNGDREIYSKGAPFDIFAECLALIVSLSYDYRMGVFDTTDTLLFGDSQNYNSRNYVKVYATRNDLSKADLTVSSDELEILRTISEKRCWTSYKQ
ncbi:MAG: radical SAM protein [Schwartzia succinivorans]|jgi:organic radical activating enzyme|uniref:radical SAM protein n=1 Tax=Schwartzia succinivorans TaxID=55507 RepID=UPI0023520AF5|nr:radical SAM protein [Schwartzia succinivorans]MBE6096673.1 radical SAM protein [Schwartzia succinivorans]